MPNTLLLISMAFVGALMSNAAPKSEAVQIDACAEAKSFMEKNRAGIKNLLNQQTDNSDVKLLLDLGKFQVEMLEIQIAKKDNAAFLCESLIKKIKKIINKAAVIEKIMNTKEEAPKEKSPPLNKAETSEK